MKRLNTRNATKILSMGIMLMGMVHLAATFTPLMADKLALLPEETQDAFTFFSLACGALLILGGYVTYMWAEQSGKCLSARKPYIFTLAILSVDGVLAVYYMPHNPFAWIIFALTVGQMFANVKKEHHNRDVG